MATSILERAGRRIGPAATADAARGRRLLRRLAWTALLTVNAITLVLLAAAFLFSDVNSDWTTSYGWAAVKVFDGSLYGWTDNPYGITYVYRYSPVLAYGFAAIAPLGYLGWTLLHFAPLLALPRKVAGIVLLSAPFWADVYYGNVTVFCFVAAYLALRGSKVGTVAFFALCLLVPRPVMLPLMVWLLWQRPETRWWFVGIFAVHALAVIGSGYGPEWIASFLRGGDDLGNRADFGPAKLIGSLWVPVGLALAAFFTWKGRIGLASICACPYWLLHYLLFGLLGRHLLPHRSTDAGIEADIGVVIRRVDPQRADAVAEG